MFQSGQIYRLQRKWLSDTKMKVEECSSDIALGFPKCVTAFCILGVGLVVALVLAVAEFGLINALKRKPKVYKKETSSKLA